MTLIEACKIAMEEIGRPATAKEIHDVIVEKNYFSFKGETPQASVSSALSSLTNPKAKEYDETINYTKPNGVNHYYFIENTEESEGIREIFLKAKDLDIQMTQWPIFTLKFYLETNRIHFSADYQRLPDLWNDIKKSRLIESILLSLPLPAFYLAETRDENGNINYEIVDGLQRLSSLKHFFDNENPLKLKNLEYLGAELNGKTFAELGQHQNRILAFNIIVYVIKDGSPEEVKYNLFKRINTGGLVLTDQEIRNALNAGRAIDFVKELATLECFKRATSYSISTMRAEDYEFVNRFLAFYLNKDSYQPDMGTFLNQALGQIAKMTLEELTKIKTNFIQAMETAWSIFGTYAFQKRSNKTDKPKPINKALFESLSVSLAKLNPEQAQKLINNRQKMQDFFIEYAGYPEFEESISRSTSDKQNIIKRYGYIDYIIKSILNNDN